MSDKEKPVEKLEKLSAQAERVAMGVEKLTSNIRQTRKAIREGLIRGGFGSRFAERIEDFQKLSGRFRANTSGGRRVSSQVEENIPPPPATNRAETPRIFTGGLFDRFFGPNESELKAQQEAKERKKAEAEKRAEEEAERERQRKSYHARGEAPEAGKSGIYIDIT